MREMITVEQWFTFDNEYADCLQAFKQVKTDVSRENLERIKILLIMCGYAMDTPSVLCNRIRRKLANVCTQEHFGKPLSRVRSSLTLRDSYKEYRFQYTVMSDAQMFELAKRYDWFWEDWGKIYAEIEDRYKKPMNIGHLRNFSLQQRFCKIYGTLNKSNTLEEYMTLLGRNIDKPYAQRIALGYKYIENLK